MAIRRYNLHPKGSPEDIIYPATDIGQVEGLNDALDKKADKSDTYTKTEVYNKSEILTLFSQKADKTTTYTKTQVNNLLDEKADKDNTYNKTEVDNALALKADKADTYTKEEVDDVLELKADKADTYTKEEVVANPSSESSTNLTKLKIGDTTYGISGGSGGRMYNHTIEVTFRYEDEGGGGTILQFTLYDTIPKSTSITVDEFISRYLSGGNKPYLIGGYEYGQAGLATSPSDNYFMFVSEPGRYYVYNGSSGGESETPFNEITINDLVT